VAGALLGPWMNGRQARERYERERRDEQADTASALLPSAQ